MEFTVRSGDRLEFDFDQRQAAVSERGSATPVGPGGIPHRMSLTTEHSGVHMLVFDNTFSVFTTKLVMVMVDYRVVSPGAR